MEWEEVPQEHRNGDIQGYQVLYHDADGPKLEKTVDASTRETSLTDLKTSTAYTIKVLAFTSVGDGPASSGISVTTPEGGKCDWICCLGSLTKKYCSFGKSNSRERSKFEKK